MQSEDSETVATSGQASSECTELIRKRLRGKVVASLSPQPTAPLLAPLLAQWSAGSGQGADQLACLLGVTGDTLNQLALMRLPRATHFDTDSEIIATYLGCDSQQLLAFLRQLQELHTLS